MVTLTNEVTAMKLKRCPTLVATVRQILENAEQTDGILDAYAAAEAVQRAHPEENIALEDIIEALFMGRGDIKAIEFTHRKMTIDLTVEFDGSSTRVGMVH
jgi:hypothetical protein